MAIYPENLDTFITNYIRIRVNYYLINSKKVFALNPEKLAGLQIDVIILTKE